MIFINPILQA